MRITALVGIATMPMRQTERRMNSNHDQYGLSAYHASCSVILFYHIAICYCTSHTFNVGDFYFKLRIDLLWNEADEQRHQRVEQA